MSKPIFWKNKKKNIIKYCQNKKKNIIKYCLPKFLPVLSLTFSQTVKPIFSNIQYKHCHSSESTIQPALVAHLDERPTGDQEVAGLIPACSGNILLISFDGFNCEIFSTIILSLPLIQEGHLSVSAKECAQVLVLNLHSKNMVR